MHMSDWSSDVCSSDLRIALVGPSGSGKSTVINLLSRNYDVMSGSVMLNDTDIRDIGNQSLRSLMAVVNQDTTLFEGRSEERRVGKECVSTCRSRWSRYH